MTIKSATYILLGAVFFAFSQDENKDYLRIYHGMWHLFIGLSAMYTWQTNEIKDEEISIFDILSKSATQ